MGLYETWQFQIRQGISATNRCDISGRESFPMRQRNLEGNLKGIEQLGYMVIQIHLTVDW